MMAADWLGVARAPHSKGLEEIIADSEVIRERVTRRWCYEQYLELRDRQD